MSYFYDGHSRLALFLANPNHDGCLHVLAVFVLLAFAAYLLRRKRTMHLVCGLICGIGTMAAASFVALTYSRGSYVSLLVVSLAASVGTVWRNRRHSPCGGLVHYLRNFWLPAAFLLLVLCALPGGGRRMATMASPAADLSIANRLHLWRGGAVVLAHNWLHGLGADCPQPARGYSLWLQPAEKHEVYRTFVSDVLTNSVRLGLPIYGLLLAWCLWGCLALLNLWYRCGRAELLWLLCSVAAFLLCGVFNTCTDETLLRNLFLTLMAAVWCIVTRARLLQGQTHLLRHGLQALCLSAIFCIGLYEAGLLAERLMPYQASPLPGDSRDHLSEITLAPRQTTASRRVLFFADNLEEHARTLLVPLASRGVYVQAVRCAGGVDSIDELRRQIADDGPWGTPWLWPPAPALPTPSARHWAPSPRPR